MQKPFKNLDAARNRKKVPGLQGDLLIAIANAEALIGNGADFSQSYGALPTNEGEVDAFIKSRIQYHVVTRLIPALRRALNTLDKMERSHNVCKRKGDAPLRR